MSDKFKVLSRSFASAHKKRGAASNLLLSGKYTIEHIRKGKVVDVLTAKNLVVKEGRNHFLDTEFLSGLQVTTWYILLLDSSPSINDDDQIGDLSEFTNYSGNRKQYNAARSGQTISNTANKAEFTITADTQTVGGAALFSAASGSTGTLLSAAAFDGGDKSGLDTADVLRVLYEITAGTP